MMVMLPAFLNLPRLGQDQSLDFVQIVFFLLSLHIFTLVINIIISTLDSL